MKIRDLTDADWSHVLALNEASVQELSELDRERLGWIVSLSARSVAIGDEGEILAFAIAIAPGTGYDSPNYRWFGARFDHFYYLDRVVVAEPFRRRGLATRLYDVMEAEAASFGRMVCDVALDPPNDPSLAFHVARGYSQVGELRYAPDKAVALMCREFSGVGEQIARADQPQWETIRLFD